MLKDEPKLLENIDRVTQVLKPLSNDKLKNPDCLPRML
jgi:hypothetical protein